jgi:hypothetical protein
MTALASLTPVSAQAKRYKLLLNTSWSGPVSFFPLADDRGYLREEGLDIAFSPGDGAARSCRRSCPGRSTSATATSRP